MPGIGPGLFRAVALPQYGIMSVGSRFLEKRLQMEMPKDGRGIPTNGFEMDNTAPLLAAPKVTGSEGGDAETGPGKLPVKR